VYVTLASLDVLLVMSIAVATVVASTATTRLRTAPTVTRRRAWALTASIALSFGGAFVILRTLTDAGILFTPDPAADWRFAVTAMVSMAPVAAATLTSGPRLRALAEGADVDVTDPYLAGPVRVAAAASLLGVWFWFVPPAPPYLADIAVAVGALTAAIAPSILWRPRAAHRPPVTSPVD
jgi:hypothetical protein